MGAAGLTTRLPREAGPELAAGGVLLAVAIVALNARMDDEWGTGIFFVLNGLACAFVLAAGIRAAAGAPSGGRSRPEAPSGAVTALLVAGQVLLVLAIARLADVLGAEGGSGSLTWTSLLFAAVAAYLGWTLRSPVSALFSALALGVAFLAAVDWIFDPEAINTFRWLLLILIVAYAAASVAAADRSERHGVQMVNAAGVATVALGLTLLASALGSIVTAAFAGAGADVPLAGPFGWELVLLVASAGLVGYAIWRREPGPGYLGAVGLLLFALIGGAPGEETSLVGWPLALLLAAGLTLAWALGARPPRREAPPAGGTAGPDRAS